MPGTEGNQQGLPLKCSQEMLLQLDLGPVCHLTSLKYFAFPPRTKMPFIILSLPSIKCVYPNFLDQRPKKKGGHCHSKDDNYSGEWLECLAVCPEKKDRVGCVMKKIRKGWGVVGFPPLQHLLSHVSVYGKTQCISTLPSPVPVRLPRILSSWWASLEFVYFKNSGHIRYQGVWSLLLPLLSPM